ncbi:hypothetical protein HAX54_049622 [Datura stramonium]|uniref:Uncharacterized protein n=1 Tax=Datura stramonium TaxID=4076 RepID=A0ABS8WKL1_DATST|nr:hypothetical protein [Datura stramonium]
MTFSLIRGAKKVGFAPATAILRKPKELPEERDAVSPLAFGEERAEKKRSILRCNRFDPPEVNRGIVPGSDMARILLKERGAFRNANIGGAWLSSDHAIRCWFKSRNERNPHV